MNSGAIHDRSLLTVKRLGEFAEYLKQHGWTQEPTKATLEALRCVRTVVHEGRHRRETLLVHRRMTSLSGGELVHVTVWGLSAEWARRFIRETRKV